MEPLDVFTLLVYSVSLASKDHMTLHEEVFFCILSELFTLSKISNSLSTPHYESGQSLHVEVHHMVAMNGVEHVVGNAELVL